MQKLPLLLLCILPALPSLAQKQLLGNFPYTKQVVKDDNAGFLVEIAGNMNNRFVDQIQGPVFTAKGNVRIFPKIGIFYQRGFCNRFSIRGSVSIGTSPFSYKYAKVLDSVAEDSGIPMTKSKFSNYIKKKQPGMFVQPQIDFGYVFGPFRKNFLLELRAGVGMPLYLKESSDSVSIIKGAALNPKDQGKSSYAIRQRSVYGQNSRWGTIIADIYLGIKWTGTFNQLLDRSSLGVQVALPVNDKNNGYADIEYMSTDWNGTIGNERVGMGMFTIGVRYTYSFF